MAFLQCVLGDLAWPSEGLLDDDCICPRFEPSASFWINVTGTALDNMKFCECFCAEGSAVGDPVFLEGSSPAAEYPKVLKSGPWKDIVAGLSVRSGRATFEGQPLVTAKGSVTLPAEMPDGAGIH